MESFSRCRLLLPSNRSIRLMACFTVVSVSRARPILVSVRSEPSSTVLVASIRDLSRFCEFQGIDSQEFAVEFEYRASLGLPIKSI